MLENFGSKTTNIIVLDLEGFKLKSLGFIIKELSLCSSYNDTKFFKPPLKFADLPTHDRQTVKIFEKWGRKIFLRFFGFNQCKNV